MSPEGQMDIDECIAVASAVEIATLVLTAIDPSTDCRSASGRCPCWADCEIAGRCLGDIDE